MKDKGYGVVANWNYVTISLVVLTLLTIFVLYMPGIREIDRGMLNGIRQMLTPIPGYIFAFVTEFGRANYMLWPQIAACSVLVSHGKYLKAFLLVFFTHAAYFLTGLLKDFVCRERPEICNYSGYSFPSNHASTTMCFYGICIYLILHYTRSEFWRYFLAIVFGIFIFLVALSRLWLGVHFPIDIIAGLFLGFLLVNLYIILVKAFN